VTDHDDAAPRDEWRVGAYAICRRGDEVLVVRASSRTTVEGRWFLPGGGVEFGEPPEDAVLRELTEETGLTGHDPRVAGVTSELHTRRDGRRVFIVRLLYEVDVEDGTLVHESGGTSDEARWVRVDEVRALGAIPYVLVALGLEAK
jgi:ADP-ribose pyrophosphatase YjhB (NUDIX family)